MLLRLLAEAQGTNAETTAVVVAATAAAAAGVAVGGWGLREKLSRAAGREVSSLTFLSVALRFLGIGGIIAGIILLATGHLQLAHSVYTLFASTAVTSIGVLIDRGKASAQRHALDVDSRNTADRAIGGQQQLLLDLVAQMQDPAKRDQVIAEIAGNTSASLARATLEAARTTSRIELTGGDTMVSRREAPRGQRSLLSKPFSHQARRALPRARESGDS
jgi:hypothetical protein